MSDDRRRCYRIDDELALTVSPINVDDEKTKVKDFWENEHAFSLRNQLNSDITQHMTDFQIIENKMPELARYISVMAKQIERVSEKVIIEDENTEVLHIKQVNLSAQGLSFYSEQALVQNRLVELILELIPNGLKFFIIATVVQSDTHLDKEMGGYKSALDFKHIHDADKEQLFKHIHSKQISAFSEAHDNDE